MIWILYILCLVILFVAAVKMSLMPLKMSISWVIFWGVTGFATTMFFAGLSRQETFALLNVVNISTLEFVELMIMLGYIFSGGIARKILNYYPGLMMIAPVSVLSFLLLGLFPGMEFALTGVFSGCISAAVMAALIMALRSFSANTNLLYKTVLAAILINILIFGLT